MAASHSYTLRGQVARLELTTRMTLAILATASGVFTYLGVRELLDGDASTVFFGAIIYSVSVSVGIYAFWSYLMRIMPHVRRPAGRRMLYLAMALGAGMIMAMSAWLNAAALAGAAALEQHMSVTTEEYQGKLNQAHENALAAQSLLPDIQLASQRFARLADEERSSGALTGTSGSGTVVQLLQQMSSQLGSLQTEIEGSREAVRDLFEDGGKRLAEMRRIVATDGSVKARGTEYAAQATELAGIIGSLQQTSVAPSVRRAAEDLGRTFIAPAADGSDAALQGRQTAVVEQVGAAVRQQSQVLAQAADAILDRPYVEPVRFVPLSAPEAVVMYARDFLPSWAGAISIDLMPAVLVFILCIVQDQIRREEGEDEAEFGDMSALDMMRALRLQQRLAAVDGGIQASPPREGPALVPDDDVVQQNEPSFAPVRQSR
ncbi:hypothetical protein [Aureimonas jatrophae]|uniref:Uncharacterized protein n=1 Tax=Aureimonas jatrophae TaxID=1166073 RepID=A0A1H0CB82_9HYPH|nr:hypothetical protein [Aureimonas jatrophae]MBB3949156.1 hypothetical protein [Aureimonas jatrophae]SDN55140.1 hypothetical protein SAMN05192530_101228 [Aureimonas jatrophae]